MDGQGRIFTGEDYPSLRKPKNDDRTSPDKNNANNETIVSKSNLSAEAKEFYPKGFVMGATPNNQPQNIQPNSVQSRLARTNPASTSVNNYTNDDDEYDYNNSTELEHLREVIMLLTTNPGKFDDNVPNLLENISTTLSDRGMMEAIIACIVDQAIEEHNFGYSGARLCMILDTYSPLTKTCLLSYCECLQFCPADSDKARNYTFFLAELFSQFDWNSAFGTHLLRMFQELLSFNQPDDIKCVCQTLKLTGMSLETSNPDAMVLIFDRLQERLPSLPSPCANILKSVLELRESHWGRSAHLPTAVINHTLNDYPPESPFVQRWSDGGPVFYGPDGLELSAEESAFLTDVTDDITHDDSDPDGLWDPDPEMDEEMKIAFKEFVAMSNKK